MKTLLIGSILVASTASFAQTIDINALKSLMTAKKATLEKVNVGMSKKVVTNLKIGDCGTLTTATETIIRVEDKGMVVYKSEKFQSQNTTACRNQNIPTSETTKLLYYVEKPSLEVEISDLDPVGSYISSITRSADLVTINMSITDTDENGSTTTEPLLLQLDLSKPAFRYNVLNQSRTYNIKTTDVADIDVKTLDLSAIAFCESPDQDVDECQVNNWSDLISK